MTLKELLDNEKYIYNAFIEAKKNRNGKMPTLNFENNLITNLDKLRQELLTRTYKIRKYTEFKVYEPKERTVLACSFRDKIVQHLICDNIIVPLFENACILDNYSGQNEKGTAFAINRTKEIVTDYEKKFGENGYIVRVDAMKYYYNIDHKISKRIMHKHLEGHEDIFWLVDMFIDSTDYIDDDSYKAGTGLALGNQINTVISNLYLAELDEYVKNEMRIEYYARYADDLYAIVKTKEEATVLFKNIELFTKCELGLCLNSKSQVMPFRNGLKFIGFHFYVKNGQLTINRDNSKKREYRRKFNKMLKLVNERKIDLIRLLDSYKGWREYTKTVTDHSMFEYYEKKISEVICKMTIENGYYVAECMSDSLPVSKLEGDTFYLPININQTEDGKYEYEEYRFNLPITYTFPKEILEYMAKALDEYRIKLEELVLVQNEAYA